MLKTMTVRATTAAILTGLSMSAHAIADSPKRVDIPAGELRQALLQVSEQFGTDLVYSPEQIQGIQTRGAHGELTTEQAVTKLLEGTPLELRTDPSGAMLITPPANSSSVSPKGRGPESEKSTSADARKKSFWSRLRLAQSDTPSPSQGEGRGEVAAGEAGPEGQQPSKREAVEEIVVTGTHIRGERPNSTPVITYDRKDVLASGHLTIDQFVRALPQQFSGGRNGIAKRATEDVDGFGNTTGITTVNLRGLAVGSTLALVNGRRMTPVGEGGDFDISVIPTGAIQRVEIVADGASAIYGSDAVAGVVNFVLRDRFDGAETSAQYGAAADSNYDELLLNQTFGRDWGSGSGLMSFDYFERGSLSAADRDFAEPTPPDADIVNSETRKGAIVSLRQALWGAVTVGLDGIYNERGGQTNEPFFDRFTYDYSTDYLNIAPSIKWEIGDNLSLEITGIHGHTETVYNGRLVEDPTDPGGGDLYSHDYSSGDVQLAGKFLSLPAGRISFAIGGGARREEFTATNLVRQTAGKSRTIQALFAEVLAPLLSEHFPFFGIDSAEFSAAVRLEDYSDYGSTVNPKFGFSVEAVDGLTLRSTYGTSFKAPAQALNPGDGGFDFLTIVNEVDPTIGEEVIVIFSGGVVQDLGPEEAESWTLGFDWEPTFLRGLSASLTYYDIRFDGRINSPAPEIVNFLADPGIYGDFLQYSPSVEEVNGRISDTSPVFNFVEDFDPANVHAFVDGRIRNIAVTKTNGLDLTVKYTSPVWGGIGNLSLNANYVTSFENQNVAAGPAADDLDKLYRPLDFKLRAGATWSNESISTSLFVNYADDYTNTVARPFEGIASYTTVDLNVGMSLGKMLDTPITEDLVLSLNVRNAFNESPPFVSTPLFTGNFYDGANADPFGRIVSVGLLKNW